MDNKVYDLNKRTYLYSKDSGKTGFEKTRKLIDETRELANIIASCILSLKGKR